MKKVEVNLLQLNVSVWSANFLREMEAFLAWKHLPCDLYTFYHGENQDQEKRTCSIYIYAIVEILCKSMSHLFSFLRD